MSLVRLAINAFLVVALIEFVRCVGGIGRDPWQTVAVAGSLALAGLGWVALVRLARFARSQRILSRDSAARCL